MVRQTHHEWPMSNRSRHKCLQAAIRALTDGLPLSRLDKAQTSLALCSLLHRFR